MLFKSNGKILLTSEYLVLDGAKSIALPSKLTQDLYVSNCDKKITEWESYDDDNNLWYEEKFYLEKGQLNYYGVKNEISEKMLLLFNHISTTKSLTDILGNKFTSKLNFKREWGLGTSSTFINNLAKWANIDPYKLLFSAFDGSGYDIACCDVNNPIIFQKCDGELKLKNINFNPPFINNIYLVHLGKKQNTQNAIKNYLNIKSDKNKLIERVNLITERILECTNLDSFEYLIAEHESIISKAISTEQIHKAYFPDYKTGKIKSLGSWGGDFILVTSKNNDLSYFRNKGFNTIFKLSDLVYID